MLIEGRYIEIIKKIIVMILVVAMTIPNMDYKVVRGDEIDNDNIYKVTFYSEDGGILETCDYGIVDGNKVIIDIYDGESIGTLHAHMVDREGYKLIGWRLQGTNEVYYDYYDSEQFENYEFDNLKCVSDIRQYKPNNDVTFVPVWKEAYSVEYYSQDGFIDLYRISSDYDENYYLTNNYKSIKCNVVKGMQISTNYAYGMRKGFKLIGWKDEETDKIYLADRYTEEWEEEGVSNYIPTKDTRFVAVWEKTATVSLYSDKGYVSGYNPSPSPEDKTFSDTLVIGEKITKYSNWIRYSVYISDYGLDYNFLGWKIEGDDTLYVTKDKWYYPNEEYPDGVKCIYDYVVKGDVQFIAVWEEKKYFDIEYYSADGYITESENYECIDGKKVTFKIEEGKNVNSNYYPQMNERENYVFVGWKVEGTNDVYYTYDSYYSAASKIYNYNELYYYKPDGNIRLIAAWMERNTYNIEFYSEEGYLEGESNNKSKVIQVDSFSSIGQNYPGVKNREGYVLVGWKEEKTGDVYTLKYDYYSDSWIGNYNPTADTRFIAVWEKACTITFYSEEGFVNEEDNKEVSYITAKGIAIGNDNYPNMNVREDYECVGWKNEKTGDVYYTDYAYRSIGIDYIDNYIPEKDIKFIAIWKKCCNVTFYSDNGVDVEWFWSDDGDDYNIIYEKTYKNVIGMPICDARPDFDDEDIQDVGELDVKDGSILVGWKNMETGDIYSYARWYDEDEEYNEYSEYGIDDIRNFIPTKDTRFEAVWKKAYNLTFNSEYGIWYDEDDEEYTYEAREQVTEGKKVDYAPKVSVNKDGYVFVGWKEEGTNDIYYSEGWYKHYKEYAKKNISDIVPTKDMNFTAVWVKADYTISFYSKLSFITNDLDGPTVDVYDFVEKNGGYEWKYSELPSVGVKAPYWGFPLSHREEYKNYKFLGWKLEGDNSGKLYSYIYEWINGGEESWEEKKERYIDFETLEINKDMKFIAVWKYTTDDGEDNEKTEDADGDGGDYVKDNQKDSKANDKKEQNASVGVKKDNNIPKELEVISDGNNDYKVTKVSKENGKVVGELSIKKWNDKKSSKVVIKDSVDINGITYKITSIEKKAFKDNKKIKTVVIGKNITKIGSRAFAGCKNLRKVFIKSLKIKKIGNNAFYRKDGKKLVISVPKSKKKRYKKLIKSAKTNKYKIK